MPDPVTVAQRLVRIPSVNPVLEEGGDGEGAVARTTARWLDAWGYDPEVAEVSPGRYNVVGRRGTSAGPTLLLNGHLDTVGVAGAADPFSGAIRDGKLFGRGAADMKGGVACILAVASELASDLSGEGAFGELIVALTADEEHASLGMAALVESGVGADAAVVCEPTSLRVAPAHKGFLWVEARVRGRAAHGSRPDEGVDAIAHMGRVLVALEEEAERLTRGRSHPLLGSASLHAGTVEGGTAPSVYPDRCRLTFERRTLPGETPGRVMRELDAALARVRRGRSGVDVALEAGLHRAATETPSSSKVVRELGRACARAGLPDAPAGMSAWVEAGFLNESGTPAVCFGPGSIAQAHAADEWVRASEIRVGARVLADFARSFLGLRPQGKGARPTGRTE